MHVFVSFRLIKRIVNAYFIFFKVARRHLVSSYNVHVSTHDVPVISIYATMF